MFLENKKCYELFQFSPVSTTNVSCAGKQANVNVAETVSGSGGSSFQLSFLLDCCLEEKTPGNIVKFNGASGASFCITVFF